MVKNINSLIKLGKSINSFRKISKSFENSITLYTKTLMSKRLTSNNEFLIKMDAVSIAYGKMINRLLKYNETNWIEESGYNMIDKRTYQKSLNYLKNEKRQFKVLSEGFVGMIRLLQVTRVSDNMNLKSLSKLYAPSLKAIEETHRYEIIKSYKILKRKIDKLILMLNKVVREIEKSWVR